MPFVKQLPHWGAPGIEPPLSLRQNGWKAGVKPPDDYFNYLQNRTYEALKELQENAVHKDDAGSGVTNLGFRGLLADPNGIGGPANIDKYPEGLSALYTDSPDWAVFLNMTDFVSALEFLFVETNKTIQDGKVNATQQITRYKKESNAMPVKLISQYKRVWYSDANYTGWSNAEKVVFQTEFATHLAEIATLEKAGHVQLSNSITGTSKTKAGTELAVKDAKEAAINFAKGFGLGAVSKVVTSVDLNNLTTENGFYYVTGTSLNRPITGNGYLVVQSYTNGYAFQTYVSISGSVYTRALNNGIWTAWSEQETTTGAQTKATKAKDDAILWAKSFGLGDVAKDISSTDLNTLAATGFFKGNSLANGPTTTSSSNWFFVINVVHTSTFKTQIAISFSSLPVNMVYTRVLNGSSWSAWQQLESTANKNQPNGYVGLGPDSKINPAQLPDQTRLELEYLRIHYSNK